MSIHRCSELRSSLLSRRKSNAARDATGLSIAKQACQTKLSVGGIHKGRPLHREEGVSQKWTCAAGGGEGSVANADASAEQFLDSIEFYVHFTNILSCKLSRLVN